MTRQTTGDSPSPTDVCAVVVTYHPDAAFPARVQRILPQVRRLTIVDNGSAPDAVHMLRDLSTKPAVTLIANTDNAGIARALNQGVDQAITAGYAWAMLLDQDTDVDADLVDALLAVVASLPDCDLPAAIGARFRDTHDRPADSRHLDAQGVLWREVESVITSGTLLSLKAFAAIGRFREDFFIDYVDTEYCLRARAAGYRVIETRRPLMSHTVGAPTRHQVMGAAKWTTNHSADRRYYIARNNTVLLREFGTAHGGSWWWKSLVRSFRLCKRIVLFEQDKLAKLKAVGQGWRDGLRGRMGPRHR